MDFTPPQSCCYWKESPPNDGGDKKKLEPSSVWVAHRSFASGRPNETLCGLHTVSFASERSNEAVCGMHAASFASGKPNETVCGLHTASLASGRSNEVACGIHTASLASRTMLQEGGGTNALLPTRGFPFLVLPPLPSPSYSRFYRPRSLRPCDVAFDGGHFCRVTWHGRLVVVRNDVAWGDRLSLVVTWHAAVVVGAA